MNPTIALVLVILLVGLLSLYRWYCSSSQPVRLWFALPLHLAQSVICGLFIWLLNLLTGWGPVRALDSILSGLGVLTFTGLALGFLSPFALYFQEWRGLFAFLLDFQPPQHTRRNLHPRSVSSNIKSSRSHSQPVALPLPGNSPRLDWCPECARWHSAQANHEHSNLAG